MVKLFPAGFCLFLCMALVEWVSNHEKVRLCEGREGHSTVLLPDGRVLVVGGFQETTSLSQSLPQMMGQFLENVRLPRRIALSFENISSPITCEPVCITELLDPLTRSCTKSSPLKCNQYNPLTVLLDDGRVLVLSGNSTAIWNSPTNQWNTVPNPAYGRDGGSLVLLSDHDVLVAGGLGCNRICEIFDPRTDTWSQTGCMEADRRSHSATVLEDGSVLVAGGYADEAAGTSERYHPNNGVWSRTGDLIESRYEHCAVLLKDGTVLILGGRHPNPDGSETVLASSEIYDPKRGLFRKSEPMLEPRAEFFAFLLQNQKVLVVGGRSGSRWMRACELYDPALGTWTLTGSLHHQHGGCSATLLKNGQVLVTGGLNESSRDSRSCELYDPNNGQWTETY